MKKTVFICSLFFIFSVTVFSQKEANIWYFGENAGLDFNSGSPVALTNGALSTSEGCASIADANGSLLFYTDGVKVWNKNHLVMTNGSGLLGHSSSTQSAIIVSKPGSNSIYYVFTVDAAENSLVNGLTYSEIDMSLAGGLGAVTANKNISLLAPTCEKITAVLHANNLFVWVITHQWNSDSYYAYLVTNSGINLTPVISHVGIPFAGSSISGRACGYLKASPKGNRLVAATCELAFYEITDFDNLTGVVSNPIDLPGDTLAGPYGVEFSSGGDLLYASNWSGNEMYQFNLKAGTPSNILLSKVTFITTSTANALQLGPDAKIYVARAFSTFLGVINNPDSLGLGCNFDEQGVNLLGKFSRSGLPSFIQSYFDASFSYLGGCIGDSTFFSFNNSNIDSINWNFGDSASGSLNHSNIPNPVHYYSDTGKYVVTSIAFLDGIADTTNQQITIHNYPVIDLGNETSVCVGDTLVLDASFSSAAYRWQDGSNEPILQVTQPGTYWVEVTANGCSTKDTIDIDFVPEPSVNLGRDTLLCLGNNFVLDAATNDASYLWQDSSTNSIFTVSNPGIYWVDVSFGDCSKRDSIEIQYENCSVKLSVPKAFSPNQDGTNDYFTVFGENIAEYEIRIFNRWGEPVYHSNNVNELNDLNKGWDGRFKGKEQATGSFVYQIIGKNFTGEKIEKTGNVLLIR